MGFFRRRKSAKHDARTVMVQQEVPTPRQEVHQDRDEVESLGETLAVDDQFILEVPAVPKTPVGILRNQSTDVSNAHRRRGSGSSIGRNSSNSAHHYKLDQLSTVSSITNATPHHLASLRYDAAQRSARVAQLARMQSQQPKESGCLGPIIPACCGSASTAPTVESGDNSIIKESSNSNDQPNRKEQENSGLWAFMCGTSTNEVADQPGLQQLLEQRDDGINNKNDFRSYRPSQSSVRRITPTPSLRRDSSLFDKSLHEDEDDRDVNTQYAQGSVSRYVHADGETIGTAGTSKKRSRSLFRLPKVAKSFKRRQSTK